MIERIADMPTGTVGLRAAGTLSKDDYREQLDDPGEVRVYGLGQEAEARTWVSG